MTAEADTREAQETTRILGQELNVVNVSTEHEIDTQPSQPLFKSEPVRWSEDANASVTLVVLFMPGGIVQAARLIAAYLRSAVSCRGEPRWRPRLPAYGEP